MESHRALQIFLVTFSSVRNDIFIEGEFIRILFSEWARHDTLPRLFAMYLMIGSINIRLLTEPRPTSASSPE